MDNLANKVAVITGGSNGIGAATAKSFLTAGMKVVIFDRKPPTALAKNDHCLFIQGDATELSALDELYAQTMKAFGKIDVLFANAGVGGSKALPEVTEELFDKVVSRNYKSIYFTVQRSLDYLHKGASLILMASAHAHCAATGFSIYASTKAAVKHLAKCFAIDLAAENIRVNSVSPGYIDTQIWDKLKQLDPNIMEKLAAQVPLNQHIASAAEVADVVKFLASSQSRYITGEDIVIDGGVTVKGLDIIE